MNKMDELQKAVNEGLRNEVTILDSTEDRLICSYKKGDNIEYATFMHDYKSIFIGHYFTTFGTTQEKARNDAWNDYKERAKV